MQIYYIEPTDDQKEAYRNMVQNGDVSFPFRVISSQNEAFTGTILDRDIQVPSSVVCMSLLTFTNESTILAQASNSREMDLTGSSGQYNHSGRIRPMMNIRQFYIQAASKMFPHSTGLLAPTPAQLKKYAENVFGKADKYTLRRFQTDKFFLPVDFSCGPMNQKDWKEKIGGLRFDSSQNRKMNLHLELEDFAGGYNQNNLKLQIYVIGLQIATIKRDGSIELGL